MLGKDSPRPLVLIAKCLCVLPPRGACVVASSSQSPPGHGGVNMSQHCHTADTVTLVTHSYTPATEPAHISRYVECREKPGVNNAISSIALEFEKEEYCSFVCVLNLSG